METQVLKEKGKEELIFETKWKTTTVTLKEFTPAGVNLEYNLEGETSGRLNGHTVATVSALIKPDRSSVYEGRGITTTDDGEIVLLTNKGKGRPEGPLSLSEAEDSYMTSSSRLAWLNNTKTQSKTTYNRITGEGSTKAYTK